MFLVASPVASHSCTEECEWSDVNGDFKYSQLQLTTHNKVPNAQVSDTTGDAIYTIG